jgi:hypothetical protein
MPVNAKSGMRGSWLPTQNASRNKAKGRFITVAHDSEGLGKGAQSKRVYRSSGVSKTYVLKGGERIRVLRKDVLDRSLGRGEFSKR